MSHWPDMDMSQGQLQLQLSCTFRHLLCNMKSPAMANTNETRLQDNSNVASLYCEPGVELSWYWVRQGHRRTFVLHCLTRLQAIAHVLHNQARFQTAEVRKWLHGALGAEGVCWYVCCNLPSLPGLSSALHQLHIICPSNFTTSGLVAPDDLCAMPRACVQCHSR